MIKLIGILIIVIGFILKLDTIAVVVVAGISTVVGVVFALAITRGTTKEMMDDGRRLLEIAGPVNILPQLLAALGSVYTQQELEEFLLVEFKRLFHRKAY